MSEQQALDIMARVTAHGALLLPDGNRVRVKAPRRLPDGLLAEIERHHAALARLVRGRYAPDPMGQTDALAGARRRRAQAQRPGAGRGNARPMTPPEFDPRAAVLAEAMEMVRRGFPVQLFSQALGRVVIVVEDDAARQNRVIDGADTVFTAAEVEAGALADLEVLT